MARKVSETSRVVLGSMCALMLLSRSCHATDLNLFKHPKTTVQITNGLPGGVDLTVHCKSKNDDLGVQVIHPNSFWSFEFRPNAIILNTLYFCSFAWPGQFRYFDIYVESRDLDKCGKLCMWNIVPDGPCAYNYDRSKYDDCYPWNPSNPASRKRLLPGTLA
ncbi:S-protein homolog 5-like [Rhodamnia argentea]|uniref:S-protein homolog n=1 Tax=Rhodamnia argentea TaxID=178133 RepID=A0A8B8QTL9_9MYRT|nr:S-protein homolog 5-like [Rhodamnia argentea]